MPFEPENEDNAYHRSPPDVLPDDEWDGRSPPCSPGLHVPEPYPFSPDSRDSMVHVSTAAPLTPPPAQAPKISRPVFYDTECEPIFIKAHPEASTALVIELFARDKEIIAAYRSKS